MESKVVILLTEDDEGHASLITRNLKRSGFSNTVVRFRDGQETLEYLNKLDEKLQPESDNSYVLMLDLRLPKMDGTEILEKVKQDPKLNQMPVIVVTTADDPKDIEECHRLGCNIYISKPVDYEKFANAIRQLGLFLLTAQIPKIGGNGEDKEE